MHIQAVLQPIHQKDFLKVAHQINQVYKNYIRPLDHEIEAIFDPAKNKLFQYGNAMRWVLYDEKKEPIGRIAAFINDKYLNKGTNFKVGGFGFFECINNQSAAKILLDTAQHWLKTQGAEAMDGPINFGDRDKWWGLLVEGHHDEPLYGMPFHPPYYQTLLENYGCKNYYNQYWYKRNVKGPLSEKILERHARIATKKDYNAKHFTFKHQHQFAKDFATVYNAAWAQHNEGKEITVEQVMNIFKQMKPIMDEKLIWFAYYKDEPIGLWVNIPDLNQYFKHFNGKLGWLQKLHLMYMKYAKKCNRFMGHSFGIVPKYQALGIDSFLIVEGSKIIQSKTQYTTIEMGWAGDWNPRMINIYKGIGGQQNRRLITYRYIFDDKHPFERHPEMDYKTK